MSLDTRGNLLVAKRAVVYVLVELLLNPDDGPATRIDGGEGQASGLDHHHGPGQGQFLLSVDDERGKLGLVLQWQFHLDKSNK